MGILHRVPVVLICDTTEGVVVIIRHSNESKGLGRFCASWGQRSKHLSQTLYTSGLRLEGDFDQVPLAERLR